MSSLCSFAKVSKKMFISLSMEEENFISSANNPWMENFVHRCRLKHTRSKLENHSLNCLQFSFYRSPKELSVSIVNYTVAVASIARESLHALAHSLQNGFFFYFTSWARKRSRVSSTASFFVVNVLSRNDVRRTDCALFIIQNKRISSYQIINKGSLFQRDSYSFDLNIYRVLLLCERRTRRLWASAKRLLSCSDFNCSMRSRISASSQMSANVKNNSLNITEIIE